MSEETKLGEGAGDKLFAFAGKVIAEIKRGEILSAVSKIKTEKLKEVELPPALEQAFSTGARKLRAKLEDVKEIAGDVVDLALAKQDGFAYRIISSLELASQSDLKRLEKRIAELERENEALRGKVIAKPKASRRTKLGRAGGLSSS